MAPKTILPPRNFWAGYAAVQAFQVMGHPCQTSPKWTPQNWARSARKTTTL